MLVNNSTYQSQDCLRYLINRFFLFLFFLMSYIHAWLLLLFSMVTVSTWNYEELNWNLRGLIILYRLFHMHIFYISLQSTTVKWSIMKPLCLMFKKLLLTNYWFSIFLKWDKTAVCLWRERKAMNKKNDVAYIRKNQRERRRRSTNSDWDEEWRLEGSGGEKIFGLGV